ncbi:acyltransferase [Enterococcus cecorum]|nr:acyltransferase [Enterococcus cecorum]
MIRFLLNFAGKDSLLLDENIPALYIFRLCIKYGLMMLRGWVFCTLRFRKFNKLFKASKVKIYCSKKFVIGSNVKLHDNVYIDALSREGVVLEDNVVIGRNSRIECTGSLNYVGKGIKIGSNTSFGSDCFFGAAGGIEIGSNVISGQNVRFHSENHKYKDSNVLIREQGVTHEGIKIGSNCWIGSGAVFLDGSEVSDGTVVAANSVVTKKFPKGVVIAGVPARIISKID